MPQEEVPVCVVRREEGVLNGVPTEKKTLLIPRSQEMEGGSNYLRKKRRGRLQVPSPVPLASVLQNLQIAFRDREL